MAEPWATISIYALIFWVAFGATAVGVLWYAYSQDRKYRRRRNMPSGFVGLLLAIIGTVTYPAAAWAALLTIRRLAGLEQLDWSPIVTVPLLMLALSVPIGAAGVLIYQRLWYR
jgi:hypothetical protein